MRLDSYGRIHSIIRKNVIGWQRFNDMEQQGDIMLILTRKVGESLVIGDDVSIIVLGVKGNQVRIGVDAPKSVSVHREEIYNKIQDEKNSSGNR